MPSYASVAGRNVPPQEDWPQPDPSLLNTGISATSSVASDSGTSKITIVPSDFKENPRSEYADNIRRNVPTADQEDEAAEEEEERRAHRSRRHKAKKGAMTFWDQATEYLLRPQVAGGLVGIVNIGLLATAGYSFYSRPALRRDACAISSTAVAALGLLSAEGYIAEQYAETPEGQEKIRRTKDKGNALAVWIEDCIHRPTAYHALVGVVNAAVAGGVAFAAYQNWNRPWTRRTISTMATGVLGLVGLDTVLLNRY